MPDVTRYPPLASGPAGGDLSGQYPDVQVTAITEAGGPTQLAIGAIPDGTTLVRAGSSVVGAASPQLGLVDNPYYVGSRTILEIDALPTLFDGLCVVVASAGTPAAPGSALLAVGDVAEYTVASGWQKLVPNASSFVAAGTRLVVAPSALTVYAPLTPGTDNGKVASFDGTSLSPSSLTAPSQGQSTTLRSSGFAPGRSYTFVGAVPSGAWQASSAAASDEGNGIGRSPTTGQIYVDVSEIAGDGTKVTGSGSTLALAVDVDAVTVETSAGELRVKPAVLAHVRKPAIVSVGASNDVTVSVSIKVVDYLGDDVLESVPFRWALSSSATQLTLSGTTPDGGVSFSSGARLGTDRDADLFGDGVTTTSGAAIVTVTHTAGAATYYLWVEVGGVWVVSSVITIT